MKSTAQEKLNVLVVDDSAVVRRFMTTILSQDRGLEVFTAADPFIAMRKMEQTRPDVILLDVEMPRMDGLTFLRKIMTEDPIPVVICSGLAGRGTKTAIEALSHGAVEIVTKPKLGVQEFLQESALMLIDTVYAAAQARIRQKARFRLPVGARLTADAVLPPASRIPMGLESQKIVAIGSSTGGPEALEIVLRALPAGAPGVAVVQHMPSPFTTAFAERLDRVCKVRVKEAQEGDRLDEGTVLIAPGDRHLMLVNEVRGYSARLIAGPLVSRHRPSVDVLFRSVAQAAGRNAIGVIMTGMGDDGVQGLLEMKAAGALTAAQNEQSCVVFGMPKAAIARDAVRDVLPLSEIPAYIMKKAVAPSLVGRRRVKTVSL
ncbi:MAG: chemotaxis response regulator protein-glutamate methylesterase [Thermoanaerobaculia bacterium]